jgi:anti-sigma factor RsiW
VNVTCRELAELLFDFVAEELPAERRTDLTAHLDRCPPCVLLVQTYQYTIRVTRHLPQRPVPDSLQARLNQALAQVTGAKAGG